MSKALQWVIGIGVVLIVAAVVFSVIAPFVLPQVGVTASGVAPRMGPGMMGRGFGFAAPDYAVRGRTMMGFGFPFFRVGMFIVPLVIVLGLIALGAALLSRRSPAQTAPAAAAAAMPSAAPLPVTTTPCAHCGQPIEAGWKACPYCGEKV